MNNRPRSNRDGVDGRDRHWCRGLASAVAVAVLATCGCGHDRAGGSTASTTPAVEALPSRRGSLPVDEVISGVVRAHNQVAIRPEISGTVVEVTVHNGDAVAAGQPLVRLDGSSLREQLRSAEADLGVAEATALETEAHVDEVEARAVRIRALAADGLTSDLELETLEAQLTAARATAGQAEASVDRARADVSERRSALAKATITAPTAGVVGQRDAEAGMVVGPSSKLFVLGDLDDLIVEVPLTQEMLAEVEVGSPVEITARGRAGEPLVAEISRISPFLEAGSFSTTAEIDVSGAAGLRPGMFVTVRVLVGDSETATLVPSTALWEDPRTGDWTVFVVTDTAGLVEMDDPGDDIPETPRTVVRRRVNRVAEGRGRTAVTGIEDGAWVVTVGQQLLQDRLDEGGDSVAARVRPTSWTRVLELQGLQREDLLLRFLAKQRAVARSFGAELPPSTVAVEEALRSSAPAEADGKR
jgi:HlyD family secretion protein